jgi:hypothetical protein
MLLLAACRDKPDPAGRRDKARTTAPENETRTLFDRIRVTEGFMPDAHVVWSPVWPTPRAELVVLYDLSRSSAPLKGAKQLTWVLRPDEGPPIERVAKLDAGIAVVRVRASELRAGRFSFRAGDRVDDSCGNPPGLPIVDVMPFWNSAESEHFVYKWLTNDPVGERVREVLVRLERRRKAILNETGLKGPPGKVTFLHYADADTGLTHQAQRGNNYDWSRNLVFSAEAEDDAHELTHLIFFREIGRHVGLFDEGVAIHIGQEIAVGSGWRDRKCHAWALDALAAGTLPPLRELLTPAQMYAKPWSVVGDVYYPAACSFVEHLIELHGLARLKKFLAAYDCRTQHDADRVAAAFEKSFSTPLDDADRKWRLTLTKPP